MKYAAIMFDVVESRKYNERYDVQKVLMDCVDYLNDIYGYAIKKDVVSSAGDEFQGLFLDLQSAFLYIRKLQLLVYPIELRCGIGYGEIKYDVDEWPSSAFDGAAYYLARDAITAIQGEKSNTICFNTKCKYDKYLNILCSSDMQIKSKQSQVARLIELIADIMLPIVFREEDRLFYESILERRCRLIEQERWNKVGGRHSRTESVNIDYEFLFENVEGNIQKKDIDGLFWVDEFWAHGMSTKIAQIMNTTRQNMDRYIASGKIKESRKMDKAIFELLGEDIWKSI
ncbi:SatD family (SatD) [Lachnospiraceae bacterium XBB1006]|nr:SatD family (SatD) [Lachnospiraceae bacterium XBB1006]